MKLLVTTLVLGFIFFLYGIKCNAYIRVRGYFRGGSYINSYYRTNANTYKWDNWSAKGNINPFTGKKGYKSW